MKKLFFIILHLSIIISVKSQVRFGLKGSLQFTNVIDIHTHSDTRDCGIAFGGFLQIPFNKYNENLFIKPEILYSQQGEYDGDDKYFQDYINIPIMIKYYLSELIPISNYGNSELFAEIGPQIGYLIHEKNKEKDHLRYAKAGNTDISIGLGAGVAFYRTFEINFRYNYGLTDVYKDYSKFNNTSNFAFSLSYIF